MQDRLKHPSHHHPLLTRTKALGCLVAAALGGIMCGGSTDPSDRGRVSSVIVLPASDTLLVSAHQQFSAQALNDQSHPLAGLSVVWSSTPASVLRISIGGLATAIASGTATITATVEGKSGQASVLVVVPAATVSLSPDIDTLIAGDSLQIFPTVRDAEGAVLTNRPLAWRSNAPLVAQVDSMGLVHGLSPGAAVISATADGQTGRSHFLVSVLAASVTLTPSVDSVYTQDSIRLVAIPKDSTGTQLTDRPVVWLSLAPSVATVSAKGWIRGLQVGATTIIATVDGHADTALVSVIVPVAHVTVTPSLDTLRMGDTTQFSVQLFDAQHEILIGRVVVWSTTGNAVVDATGVAVATAPGPALVIASSVPAGIADSARLVLLPPKVDSISVQPESLIMVTGSTLGYGATPYDSLGNQILYSVGPVVWRSSSTGVARVNTHAFVTTVSPGTTTLSATADGVTGGTSLEVEQPAYSSISAGSAQGCALSTSGRAFCWGIGQLDVGAPVSSAPWPLGVRAPVDFKAVSAGAYNACALAVDDSPWCWGSNQNGALGSPSAGDFSLFPTAVQTGHTFSQISAGEGHTCALTAAGLAYCWGFGEVGALGTGSSTDAVVPTAVSGGLAFQQISVNVHVCALTVSGQAYCWGDNSQGQLGNSTHQDSNIPVAVAGGLTFSRIVASATATCAIGTNGFPYCWGGITGDAVTPNSTVPVRIDAPVQLTDLALAMGGACGAGTDGELYCWDSGSSPTVLPGASGLNLSALTGSVTHYCGIGGGVAYCWGDTGPWLGAGFSVSSPPPPPLTPIRVLGQP